jgi:hypothetical protein
MTAKVAGHFEGTHEPSSYKPFCESTIEASRRFSRGAPSLEFFDLQKEIVQEARRF